MTRDNILDRYKTLKFCIRLALAVAGAFAVLGIVGNEDSAQIFIPDAIFFVLVAGMSRIATGMVFATIFVFTDKDGRLHLHHGRRKDIKHGASWHSLFGLPKENYVFAYDLTGRDSGQFYLWYEETKGFGKHRQPYRRCADHREWRVIMNIDDYATGRHLADVYLSPGELLNVMSRNFGSILTIPGQTVISRLISGEDVDNDKGKLTKLAERVGKVADLLREEVKGRRPPERVQKIAAILGIELTKGPAA